MEVEALRYDGTNLAELREWAGSKIGTNRYGEPNVLTLEGLMHVSKGDWLIRGVAGEFYPCKPEIFERSYELVENKPSLDDPQTTTL